jgi:acyl-CoA dehydrogenase
VPIYRDVFPKRLGRFGVIDLPETEDLALLRRQAQELMRSFPVDYWRERDRNREFPREYFEAAARQGFFGITVPEEYGGLGMGMEAACAVMNEVARQGGGLPAGDIMMRELVFGGLAISRFGTKEAKEKYLPALVEGKTLMAIGHTEPNAGVNRKDGGFVVRGQKVWITLGHMADLVLLIARTTPTDPSQPKAHGLTVMLLETKDNNVRAFPIRGMSMRPLTSTQFYIEDAWVPEENVLGEVDRGWEVLKHVFNAERLSTSSIAVGCGEYALSAAVRYARERVVFGRPIGSNQGIQFPLAQAYAELYAAKLMTQFAARLFDSGKECAVEANIASLLSARAAFSAADRAVQTYGGMGFAEDNDLERFFRDVRLFKTGPVPEEMVLNFLATRGLGLPRSF